MWDSFDTKPLEMHLAKFYVYVWIELLLAPDGPFEGRLDLKYEIYRVKFDSREVILMWL